jgi:hypothetical protein
MIEELNEGIPIMPRKRHVERDALKWRILRMKGDEVTFRAGTEVFRCHKSSMIYREWVKELHRREMGGAMEEPGEVMVINTQPIFEPIWKAEEARTYVPVLRMIDSQLEERQHRIEGLRKKAALMDWCNHERDICTGKCKIVDEIVAIEKKMLGDP